VGGDVDAIIVAGDVQLVRLVGQSLRLHLDGRLQQNCQIGKKVILSNYVRRLTSKKIQIKSFRSNAAHTWSNITVPAPLPPVAHIKQSLIAQGQKQSNRPSP
jgi:hypothetical protein